MDYVKIHTFKNSSRYLTAVRQVSFAQLGLTFGYVCHFGFKIVLDTVFALLHCSAHSNRHLVILVTSSEIAKQFCIEKCIFSK